ncbi:hypothetical protein KY347_04840 [Candidatus Woesearchaeota archaeon]|nr:hypothetical protein [Candidatus Woesearchaeota archaeon]
MNPNNRILKMHEKKRGELKELQEKGMPTETLESYFTITQESLDSHKAGGKTLNFVVGEKDNPVIIKAKPPFYAKVDMYPTAPEGDYAHATWVR